MFITRYRKSSGTSMRLRNPARVTRSTRALRHLEKMACENSAVPGNDLRSTTSQTSPAERARETPAQSGRLAMTSGTSAESSPKAIFSTKFSSVEPPPEIRTPSLIGRARAAGTGRKGVMLVTLAPGYATSVGQGYQLSRAGCGATDRVGILRPREIVAGG